MQNDVDLQVLKVVVSKLDETLEKISDSTASINRLLIIHDSRLDHLEKDSDITNKELKDIYTRMETQTKEILSEIKSVELRIEDKIEESRGQSSNQHQLLSVKVDALDKRLNTLEQWRWYIAGGLAVVAFLIAKLETISKILF